MNGTIVHGGHLIIDSRTSLKDGAVFYRDDRIVETGLYGTLAEAYPGADRLGGDGYIVMPGFINAHSHGKGITDFQRGQPDDSLETWKWRSFPPIDLRLDTLYFTVKCLEAGVTTTMHNHNIQDTSSPYQECETILRAYGDSAVRVCFSPVLTCKNPFIYGDNRAFTERLPGDLRKFCTRVLEHNSRFGPREYMKLHSRLVDLCDGNRISLFHGPLAPQWVDDDTLRAIAADSIERGLPLHLHTQQTRLQDIYGYKTYGHSLLRHLLELGILEADVTCGHCVWVSDEDIDILADTGTSITHHPACNLRIRNGIAPVDRFVEKGVPVAMGMDDKDMNDNRDFLEDLRLASRLHRVNSCRPDAPCLGSSDFFRMATENGARVLGMQNMLGKLQPGMKADILLVDMTRMAEPFTFPDHDIFDVLIYRGKSTDIDTVIIDGKVVMQNGKIIFLDRDALVSQLAAAVPSNYVELFREQNRQVPELRKHIAAYYGTWCSELEKAPLESFYTMNSRKMPIDQ